MSKTWAVIRREFGEFVRSRMFVFGTLFGPLLIALVFLLPALLTDRAADREIVIVDGSGAELGPAIAGILQTNRPGESRFTTAVVDPSPGESETTLTELRRLVAVDSLDGYVWLPPGLASGETVVYEGHQATNPRELRAIRSAVDEASRQARLRAAGIDPDVLASALQRVPFEARRHGDPHEEGGGASSDAMFMLVFIAGFVIYIVIILYGNALLRGVREEKDGGIVEIILSSLRPEQLMAGKVFGIGAAGLLQVGSWVAFAFLSLRYGESVIAALGGRVPDLPAVSLWGAVVYLAFFTGGYFLYACLYAALGAVATSSQDAQHLQYPALAPLMVGYFMVFSVLDDPGGAIAVAGSIIPLTSPMVMPARALLTSVPVLDLTLSMMLLVATCALLLWIGGRVYRVTILATGQRPSVRQLWTWVREG